MTAWIIRRGRKIVGRVLARDPDDAREKARQFWGEGEYKIEEVKR